MICAACVSGRESECWGVIKHKSWCDNQMKPGINIDQQFCKHLRFKSNKNEFCPNCGKSNESIILDEQTMETNHESSTLLGE